MSASILTPGYIQLPMELIFNDIASILTSLQCIFTNIFTINGVYFPLVNQDIVGLKLLHSHMPIRKGDGATNRCNWYINFTKHATGCGIYWYLYDTFCTEAIKYRC